MEARGDLREAGPINDLLEMLVPAGSDGTGSGSGRDVERLGESLLEHRR